MAIATGMRDGGSQREGRATAHLVTLLRPNVEPPLTLSRPPLLPLLNRCQGTSGGVGRFHGGDAGRRPLIHDQEAQRTVPPAARVVGPLGPRTGPTLALCRSAAAAAPSRGFGGRFHGRDALRQGLIRDAMAQQTGPDAARVVAPLGPHTSPTLTLCRFAAAAAPSRGFGGRFHGGEALRRSLNS